MAALCLGILGRARQLFLLAIVVAAALISNSVRAQEHSENLTLVVPGSAGGSWDLTARAMKDALEREGIVDRVSIIYYPGAGGLIGLSQFVERHRGRGDVLLVGGLVMLSSSLREGRVPNLSDVNPVARLSNEWGIIYTSERSGVRSLDQLISGVRHTPGTIRWGGGSLGGPDHGLLWSIARQTRTSIDDMTYFARTGDASIADLLAEGRIDVAVSGYAEYRRSLAQSRLRVLGVAAPRRLSGIEAPTLRETGVDALMVNWRGVFAAPGIDAAAQARLSGLIAAMRATPTWQRALSRGGWADAYLDAPQFSRFLANERLRWHEMLTPPPRAPGSAVPSIWVRASQIPLAHMLGLAAGIAGMMAILVWRLHVRKGVAEDLERQRNALAQSLEKAKSDVGKLVKDGIDIDFDEWKLSGAEADIAWFMIRGLPLRDIASMRGTSERTVRQQAQSIYRKAGLEGRSDLAGRVLERFI